MFFENRVPSSIASVMTILFTGFLSGGIVNAQPFPNRKLGQED